MMNLTGKEYLAIDIANQFGLDKISWSKRIEFVNDHTLDELRELTDLADNPILYTKALHAMEDTIEGNPTGFIMSLDCTASGLQIIAALMGCPITAANVNLIDTGKREDIYEKVTIEMNGAGVTIEREEMKYLVMPLFYGSKAKPKRVFGEDTVELQKFYDVMYKELPGGMEYLRIVQSYWNGNAYEHTWTMPDGHVCKVLVMGKADEKIEIEELGKATFIQRCTVNMPNPYGLALAANIVQSIDGYIVREMLRRCHRKDVELACIHDSFWCHPNNMNVVRRVYIDIMKEIADSDMLSDILSEIHGGHVAPIRKKTYTLSKMIDTAEYALS